MPWNHPALAVRRALATGAAALLAVSALPALPAQAAAPTPIAQIQGTGTVSPLVGKTVTTEPALVTAVYPSGPGSLGGFVIQTPGTGGKRNLSAASQAVFVYTGTTQTTVKIGDAVQVTGVVGEYNGLTQLSGNIGVTPLTQKLTPVKPVTNKWADTASTRENLESMLYQPSETFTVSNTYNVGRYGEVGLVSGRTLPMQPTEAARPGTPQAAAQTAFNEAMTVTLDDGTNRGFAASPTQAPRSVPYITPSKPGAVGDAAHITKPVIVDYRYNLWRFQPTSPVETGGEPVRIQHRDEAVPGVGGQLRIATFNVLNYFTTTGDAAGCKGSNYSTDGTFNVASGCSVRGAFDAADLARQQAKTVSAINALSASVVGLMEVENSARLGEKKDEALDTLVAALNKAAGYTKWAAAHVPADQYEPLDQQDFIQSAIIYQPSQATLTGPVRALGTQATVGKPFNAARTPIAATFTSTGGGKTTTPTTVVVNHFKSKGSAPKTGPDADKGDGQGAWNATRVAQANALLGWIPELTKQAGSADIALIGDFNSYSQEDPIQVFAAAGFKDAAPRGGAREFTYQYDGLSGSLDHVLLSPSLAKRLTGAAAWNINSVQSPLLQYAQYRTTAQDYYQPNWFASSDHDPFIAGFRAK
jgi:predicted extracellular nuclease